MPYTKILLCCQFGICIYPIIPPQFPFIEIAPTANMTQRVWFPVFPAICVIYWTNLAGKIKAHLCWLCPFSLNLNPCISKALWPSLAMLFSIKGLIYTFKYVWKFRDQHRVTFHWFYLISNHFSRNLVVSRWRVILELNYLARELTGG